MSTKATIGLFQPLLSATSRVASRSCNSIRPGAQAPLQALRARKSSTSPNLHSTRLLYPSIKAQPFSSTPRTQKKGNKAARSSNSASSSSSSSSTPDNTNTATDPFDFTDLETAISKTQQNLKDTLSLLRPGGRFNPQTLETLRVQLPQTKSNQTSSSPPQQSQQKQTVALSDIAQVLPKSGRTIQILVSEPEFIKPVSSALSSSGTSTLSLGTPQSPDPANPCLLVVAIPAATAESRKEVVDKAGKAGELAGVAIRNARGTVQKRLRGLGVEKKVRPDDLRKAGERMEKIVEGGMGQVKKIVEAAKKALDA